MLSDKQMRDRMKKGWPGGGMQTVCGNGSTGENTRNIRLWLPMICAELNISSVCDAGAGDLSWIRRVPWNIDYRAFDLIPLRKSVKKIDITRKALPECDAILCRFVLNHLDAKRNAMALKLFRQSAKYLFATQFDVTNKDIGQQFRRIDWRDELGEPIDSVQDANEEGCTLAVWKL